jgi:DNA-directed RNA polymerase specialized sigma subunit
MRCLGTTQPRPLLTITGARRIGKLFQMVPLMSSLEVLEHKEVLSLLAQRIAQLPLASKKILAMYYYENLPISEIAACFNLPACHIEEILTQTVGLLRNDLLK